MADESGTKNCVLVGGGHSQVEVLRQFGLYPQPRLRLTLVTRDLAAPYSGMLTGYVAGHYTHDDCHIDLQALADFARCDIVHDEVKGLDLDNKQILCREHAPISFDLLSVNVGSRPSMNGVPGASEHALPIKPVDDFIQGWKTIVKRAQETTRQTARRLPRPLRLLVVGGGAGGVELILAMQHGLLSRLAEKGKEGRHLEFQVLTASEEILSTHTPAVRKRIRAILHARNIRVHTQQKVVEVTPTTVECESGSSLPYDALIWTTHASPAPWLAQSGLDTDGEGFLLVNNTLQSTSHPFVFAAGDTAAILDHPTPKAGVFAVRQGPFLAKNLRHALGGEPLETYRPQKTFLSLISTGGKNAIASKGPWSIEGRLVWHLKDWIDRRFMAKYAIRADGPAPNPL